MLVYWVDSIGRRNISQKEVSNGATEGLDITTDRAGTDAL